MSAKDRLANNRSQHMRRPKTGCRAGKSPQDSGTTRCHIDVPMTPDLKAGIAARAEELDLDLSKFMRLSATVMLGEVDKGSELAGLIREREDHDLERALHGLFWLLNLLAGEALPSPPDAPLRSHICLAIEMAGQREVRDLIRELLRLVAQLVEIRRKGAQHAHTGRGGDLSSPEPLSDGGAK